MSPGLKPGQRKVLFTCMKRNDKREVKVAQLAGSVAEMSAYHHGEVWTPVSSSEGKSSVCDYILIFRTSFDLLLFVPNSKPS